MLEKLALVFAPLSNMSYIAKCEMLNGEKNLNTVLIIGRNIKKDMTKTKEFLDNNMVRIEKLENSFKEIVEKIAGSPLEKEIKRQKIIEKINYYKDRMVWFEGCLNKLDKEMNIAKKQEKDNK